MLTGQSWVRVITDGKMAFEAILEQGETRSWVADQSMTIRVGNAGGVMYSFNQSEAQPMGELGMPEERTFATECQYDSWPVAVARRLYFTLYFSCLFFGDSERSAGPYVNPAVDPAFIFVR